MKLSIIIPVYNEEATLEKILTKVINVKLPEKMVSEIIIVNDGSSDNSAAIAKHSKSKHKKKNIKLISHRKNKGKGAAVRTGIKNSTGEIILIQDADLEYNPRDYPQLLKPIIDKEACVVYGTRLKNYPLRLFGRKCTPLLTHYLGNKFLTLMTNLLYGNGVTDMETCYKVFERKVLRGINLKANRFEFEPEFTAKVMKKGIKIVEIPIKVRPRGYDEGKKITWKDGFIALWTLIKYRFVD